jgi:DtxR family transcriptional regulator, Mn-dependent transcriptional regulator
VVSHLIDSTEMYVRTVWELEEEGIPPIRARLSERLQLSAPSVSETVSRLEEEGLLRLTQDRTLELTARGRDLAASVMRKHRLAERLLVDVIGLEWEHVHPEACRWEHVISDDVERKLVQLLDGPTRCPHGNPIPGLAGGEDGDLLDLAEAAKSHARVRLRRISELLQSDVGTMASFARVGLRPDAVVDVSLDEETVVVAGGGGTLRLDVEPAQLVYVEPVA